MKALSFGIPISSTNTIIINLPVIKLRRLKPAEKFLKLGIYFSLVFYFLWIFLLPISVAFKENNSEYAGFSFYIIGMLIWAVLFFSAVILRGRKFLIDPNGFVLLLIYSLAITTASVTITPADITNTFGSLYFKATGGLMVMGNLALFYLTSVYITNGKRFKNAIKALVFGYVFFLIYVLFKQDYDNVNIIILVPSVPVLLSSALYSKQFRLIILSVLMIILYVAGIQGFEGKSGYGLDQFAPIFTFCLLISSLALSLIYFFVKRRYLQHKLALFTKSFNREKAIDLLNSKNLINLAVVFLPVLLLVYLLYLLSQDLALSIFFDKAIDDIKLAWDLLNDKYNQDPSAKNLKDILVGLGNPGAAPSNSYISNVLYAQGLVGLAANFFIWSFGIFKGLKVITSIIAKNQIHKLVYGMAVILTYIPLLSIFIYPGIYLIILWWICFSLIFSLEGILKNGDLFFKNSDFELEEAKLLNRLPYRLSRFMQLMLIVVIGAAAVLFSNEFFEILSSI